MSVEKKPEGFMKSTKAALRMGYDRKSGGALSEVAVVSERRQTRKAALAER